MSRDRARRQFRASCVLIALVLACIPLGVVVAILGSFEVQQRRLVRLYEDTAARSQQRTYTRAADTPGWSLLPGAAADDYIAAYEGCGIDWAKRGSRMALGNAVEALRWQTMPLEYLDGHEVPGTAPIPPECVEIGVPTDHEDPVVAQLTAELCLEMRDCAEAMDLLERGSRREQTTSPITIWSEWAVAPDGNDYRMVGDFLQLARMDLVRANIAVVNGAPVRDELRAALGVLRFGSDLGQGSGLLGLAFSVVIQRAGFSAIAAHIEADTLTADDAAWLYTELAYVNRHPVDYTLALEADFVELFGGLILQNEDVVRPATAATWASEQLSGYERLLCRLQAGDMLRYWRGLLAMHGLTHPDRMTRQRDLFADAQTSAYLDSTIGASYEAFDVRATLTRSSLLLLQLAAAEAAVRLQTGLPPSTLDEILAVHPDAPITDPLTDEPYELITIDGQRLLRSPVLHPRRLADSGIVDNWDPELWLTIELPPQDREAQW